MSFEDITLEMARLQREALQRINAKIAASHEGQAFIGLDREDSEMNDARRKSLNEALAKLEEVRSEIEMCKDDEQEYFDNMPESFQAGEKGDKAQEAVSAMEDALTDIENAANYIENAVAA